MTLDTLALWALIFGGFGTPVAVIVAAYMHRETMINLRRFVDAVEQRAAKRVADAAPTSITKPNA